MKFSISNFDQNVLDDVEIFPPQGRKRSDGFTLVELLVVLVILGLVMSFVTPQVMKYLSGAKADVAKIQIQRLTGVLDLYLLDLLIKALEILEVFFTLRNEPMLLLEHL